MAETTIEWTRGPRGELGYTFNGWIGCTKISPGCDNCYAAAQDKFRSWTPEGWGAGKPRRRTSESNWGLPYRWNDAAAKAGERRRVFCSSLADVFDNEVDPAWRADLLFLIEQTPHLDWLLLTKRIGNAASMLEEALAAMRALPDDDSRIAERGQWWPWPNVWLGATIVNQEEADRDIPKLLGTPARVRFLSMEPLLGPVDLSEHLWGRPTPCADCPKDADCECGYARRGKVFNDPALHWVIVGGESGHGARPMHSELVRMLRDQCSAAGVPFLFKQWGEFLPGDADANDPSWPDVPESRLYWIDGSKWDRFDGQRAGVSICARVGKKAAGRLLDGVEHNGFPEVR